MTLAVGGTKNPNATTTTTNPAVGCTNLNIIYFDIFVCLLEVFYTNFHSINLNKINVHVHDKLTSELPNSELLLSISLLERVYFLNIQENSFMVEPNFFISFSQ